MARDTGKNEAKVDPNTDHFAPVDKALGRIAAEATTFEGNPEHLECHFLQSGEVTWRMWIKGEDEPVGNVISGL